MYNAFLTKRLFVISLALSIVACEKKETTPEPEPIPATTNEPVGLLNDGSGFTQVYDAVHVLSSATPASPSITISDFTLENGDNLNLVYHTITPTQQDQLFSYFRRTKNLSSKSMVPQPSLADTLGLYLRTSKMVFERFRPYTNFFVYATFNPSTGFGSNNTGTFGGDLNASVSSPNPVGSCDMGFRCPVMNSFGGFGYFFLDAATPAYKMNCSSKFGGIGSQANLQEYMGESVHEIYRGGAEPDYFAFGLKKDSLKVFKVTPVSNTSTMVTSVKLNTSLTPGYGYSKPIRHYNTSGSILSLFYKELTTDLVYTFVYDFTTNTLTKKLDGATLEYSGTGSDIDVDESGNVFYTGTAGNGSNTTGVSIYKKSGAAAPELVGADNLLKFGTVVQLKVFSGKVFFAVSGKQTGKNAYQLSILKQD